jgi:hypothetical protein
MQWFWTSGYALFDGNRVDVATLILALLYAAIMHRRVGKALGRKPISMQTGLCVVHGIALFPLLLLSLSVFSSQALEELVHSDKIIISVAGIVALLAVLEDRPPA